MPVLSAKRKLIAVALAALWASCAHAPAKPPVIAPDELGLPAVGPVAYSAHQLAGKVVLVDFFATWCFPCIAELPLLKQIYEKHAARGFAVVMVGLDLEGARVLEPFAQMYELPFPILVADERVRTGQSAFGSISALPTHFLLGRDGRVLAAYEGITDPQALSEQIERALSAR